MKLIDILVKELPKRGGWPKRANCITQDGDLKVEPAYCHPSVAKCDDDGFWFLDSSRIGGFEVDTLASDYTTAIITREQYEAALAAKNEGWIEWGGGECPVDAGKMVDVIFGYGGRRSTNIADCWRWNHNGTDSDIIAYRLHKPQEAAQPKADEEADLNECIGQDAAPVWNGEGLPPVGCECEWQDKNTKQWQPVKVVYSSEWITVIREINKEKGDDLVEIAIENYGDDARIKFRPIRSEAERKRDIAIQSMNSVWREIAGKEVNGKLLSIYEVIYDAIAAGKIPGAKLDD